jgi:hypothetical protein
VTPPQVVSGTFAFASSQAVSLTFSEDVMASLDPADLSVVNLATGLSVPASEFALNKQGGSGLATTATWTHTGPLPDGNYRATLPARSVADAAGNKLAADYTLDFFTLAGDANRDRAVNFNDLLILAKNYNQAGATFDQGDFNYDGTVNFSDLLILAKNYNAALPPAATGAVAVPVAAPAFVVAPLSSQPTPRKKPVPVFSDIPVRKPAPQKGALARRAQQ